MKHHIDPKIDCVFKAVLGTEENRNLLIHFLNSILQEDLPTPIAGVDILNPYNEKESLNDKLSIVDVKARDQQGQLYQVEIQLLVYPALPSRMVYTWADLYSQQLQSGQDYETLQPTYAIWLVAENVIAGDERYAREYRFRDDKGVSLGRCLSSVASGSSVRRPVAKKRRVARVPEDSTAFAPAAAAWPARSDDHGGIWLLELNKFQVERIETEQQRWLKFFKEGERLDDEALPEWMNTDEMRQAMNTVRVFSEKERHYH